MVISPRNANEAAADYALRVIKANIISLDLEPGSPVSENELSDALGISRTPVREALIELSKVRIIESIPQKKTYVAPVMRLLKRQDLCGGQWKRPLLKSRAKIFRRVL